MAIDEATLVEEVRRIARVSGKVLDPADVRDAIPVALQVLGRQIFLSSDYPLQQKEYTLTLASGKVDLSGTTTLIIDSIESVVHPDIDGSGTDQNFSKIPDGTRRDLQDFVRTLDSDYPFVVENNALYLSLGNGTYPASDDLPPNTVLLIALASEVPTLTTIHAQFKDELVGILLSTVPQGVAA